MGTKRMMWLVASALAVVLLLASCNSVGVYRVRGRGPGIGHGPPAHAQAHGYRRKQIGGYDLIITGQRALDTGASQIGPRLAEYLDLPQVLEVREVSGLSNGKLRAKRNWKAGFAEVEVGLPALLSVAPQANEPRYPHGARIMSAYREWKVTTWGLGDLGLTEEELSPLIGLQRKAFPPERTLGELLTGAPDEAARELAQLLREAGG